MKALKYIIALLGGLSVGVIISVLGWLIGIAMLFLIIVCILSNNWINVEAQRELESSEKDED